MANAVNWGVIERDLWFSLKCVREDCQKNAHPDRAFDKFYEDFSDAITTRHILIKDIDMEEHLKLFRRTLETGVFEATFTIMFGEKAFSKKVTIDSTTESPPELN